MQQLRVLKTRRICQGADVHAGSYLSREKLGQTSRFVLVTLVVLCAFGMAACHDDAGDERKDAKEPALVNLPLDRNALGVRLYPPAVENDSWCLFRTWPDDKLAVYRDCDGQTSTELLFPAASTSIPVAATKRDGNLWLAVYDVERSVPSGRTIGAVSEGIDIYRFRKDLGEPILVVSQLPLGGIDTVIYMQATADGVIVCGTNRCVSVDAGGSTVEWPNDALRDYEFVEIALDAAGAKGIVRLSDDHVTGNSRSDFHFAWARMSPTQSSIDPISSDCVPKLSVGDSGVGWVCAESPADLAELLDHDLHRALWAGALEFGSSNTEGRIAWSAAYYLNGLMQLGSKRLPRITAAHDWTHLRERIQAECDLIAQRVLTSEGIASRRYALHRTELTFALHLGRMARVLAAAVRAGYGDQQINKARAVLLERLSGFDGTVEQPAEFSERGIVFATLGYARGSDFWADGANVPFNYISGYADGLVASGETYFAGRAWELMRPLLVLESPERASIWRYWWGPGSAGWNATEQVSTNTPQYGGNGGLGHITYRSMDAAALVRIAHLAHPDELVEIDTNIRSLTEQGLLLPWISEALMDSGGLPAELRTEVAYRYSRSAAPWELQSQVWALEKLAEQRR